MTAIGEILYGPVYDPPPGDQVDFQFDLTADTEGENYFDLPMIGIAGYGTVSDTVRGDVVLKMPYITGCANGSREANGALALPAVTIDAAVSVNNPIELPRLIVSGWTGARGEVAIPAARISGTASQVFRVGRVVLPSLKIEGTANTPLVANGEVRLRHLVVSGWTGASAGYSLPKLSVQGHAISQAPAFCRYNLPAIILEGIANTPWMATGTYLLPACQVSGTAVMGPVGSGQFALPAVDIKGSAHHSPPGDRTGEYVLPAIGIQGFVNNQTPPYIIRHRRYPCSA